MLSTYSELIAEHEDIARRADLILDDVANPDVTPDGLSQRLGELALIVDRHVEKEASIIAGMDGADLAEPWAGTWRDGAAMFDQLRDDWSAYLTQWSAHEIAAARPDFAVASIAMFDRLRTRVEQETRAFYAAALQHGAITLR